MEEDAAEETEADAKPGIPQCVDLFQCKRLVDGNVPVDRDVDDDVDRADTEGIGQGQLNMSLNQSIMIDEYRQSGNLV